MMMGSLVVRLGFPKAQASCSSGNRKETALPSSGLNVPALYERTWTRVLLCCFSCPPPISPQVWGEEAPATATP